MAWHCPNPHCLPCPTKSSLVFIKKCGGRVMGFQSTRVNSERSYPFQPLSIIIISCQWLVYSSCLRSAVLHCDVTWAPNLTDIQHLCWNDHVIIRWNTRLTNQHSTSLLLKRLFYFIGMWKEQIVVLTRCEPWIIPGPHKRRRAKGNWSKYVTFRGKTMTPTMSDKFYRSSFKNYGFTVQKKSAILSFITHSFFLSDNIAHRKSDNLNGIWL